MSWLTKILPKITSVSSKKDIPAGLWVQCQSCSKLIFREDFERHLSVCHSCDYHHRISARERMRLLFDDEQWFDLAESIHPNDVLGFKDSKSYKDRLKQAKQKTGESEALLVGKGQIDQQTVVMAVFEFGFIGGSMGVVVGDRFLKGVEEAIKNKCPFICLTASGGARMQEGVYSLMQMPRTASALSELSEAKLPYVSVLLDPTSGGVAASLAMLGDVIIAEPNALIGFTGPRVIQQTVKQTLPEGFQRSEFLLQHGAIDAVVHRKDLKKKLSKLIKYMSINCS